MTDFLIISTKPLVSRDLQTAEGFEVNIFSSEIGTDEFRDLRKLKTFNCFSP